MKLGLLGGTFDPIHLGHLRAAENAREGLGLERVLFVPAHVPPHRRGPVTSARDRYAMVALATANHPAFVASDLELQREGTSYTVDTARQLRRERPGDQLVLIVGSDTWPEIKSWREPEALRELVQIAVVERPGAPAAGDDALSVAGSGLAVSSTEIRRLAGDGKSIRYLVPEAVADFIVKRELYR